MSLLFTKLLNYDYKKTFYYIKSTGYCVFLISGCWLLYQIKQTSRILNSVVPSKVLDHSKVQYIYIDDPRFQDIFIFSKATDLDLLVKDDPKRLSYKIMKWWKLINRNFAFRYLNVAQVGNQSERKKAVESLSSLQHLKDWHYCHIAQMLDARTAVSLARYLSTDLRFFLKPPYFHVEHKLNEIIDKIYNLLVYLNASCNSGHPCLVQFLQKKFHHSHCDTSTFEHDLNVNLAPTSKNWDEELLKACVQAVHHHSSLEEHSEDVVKAGALEILMNVYKYVGDNVEICIFLAKIISNLSLHTEYLEDIFKSGWIGILAAWSRHEDIRLASPASRALKNLDSDDNNNEKYPQRIFPLYPLHKVPYKQTLDLIFLHGLLGGVFVTWRQRDINVSVPKPIDLDSQQSFLNVSALVDGTSSDFLKDFALDLKVREWQKIGQDYEFVYEDCPLNLSSESLGPFFCSGTTQSLQQFEKDRESNSQCWPKDWLPEDVPNLRIIGINYDTNLSMWTPLCPIEGVRSTIKERSNEFARKLATAGVGKRSIVWACHSMGGLLVKQMLVEEWRNGDKNNLLKNTKGIVFYSTPHRGSHVAALKQTTQMLIWPSVEVQELREQSTQLLRLHDDFLKMIKEHNIDIISFGETKSTLVTSLKVPLRFVDLKSADPEVGEFYEIPLDHFSICKPANRQSFLYQKLLLMIKKHIQSANKTQIHTNSFLYDGKFIEMVKKFIN